jgi:protein O-GlcNAc transferase
MTSRAKVQLDAGLACVDQGDYAGALAIALTLLEADPESVEAMHLAGLASVQTGQPEAAVYWLQQVLRRQPENAHAHWRLGKALQQSCAHQAAFANLDDAHALGIDAAPLLLDRFNAACQALEHALETCSWRYLARYQQIVREALLDTRWMVGEITLACPGFTNAMLSRATGNHARQVLAGLAGVEAYYPPGVRPSRGQDRKLRLGFVGDDFFEQATAYLMTSFIEQLDRQRFECWAYETGDARPATPFRQRVVAAFDQFVNIKAHTDEAAARRIHYDRIDILVSLKNPASARLGVFARRPAPIQLHYLYYPGTSGMPFFDYIVADEFVVPPAQERNYSEQVLRLPGCYQPNDARRPLAADSSHAQWRLPDNAIILANFGQAYKITPAVFDLWCLLLRSDERRILWLLWDNAVAAANLRREAQARGVDPGRLHFAEKAPISVHLARLRRADLVLDTYPYGGHTLTSDALWAATPVVTLCGETFASRVAGSLLMDVGLPQLVGQDEADYVAIAEHHLSDPAARAQIRRHLDAGRDSFALFDASLYAKRFGDAMVQLQASV